MNRIGLNTFINSSSFTDDDLGLIERYSCFGFDVVEFAVIDPQMLSRSKLKTALAKLGNGAADFVWWLLQGARLAGKC